MKAHCPKCGGVAKLVSQKPHTIHFAEAVFKCEDTKCGSEVVAEITFDIRSFTADQCFTSGAENASASVKTDC